MSISTTSDRPARRTTWLLPVLGLVLVAASGVGAWSNWYLWHPMSGLVVTIAAVGLLLVGGLALLVRSNRLRPIGLVLAVAAVGTVVGQQVGPDRPAVRRHDSGTLRLVLTAPAAFDASGKASCGSAADASQVVVDPDEFGLARSSDRADFHYVYVTIGDMYDYGARTARSDHLSVVITVMNAGIPADADPNVRPGETRHTSDAASNLVLAPGHSVNGGSITFSNLALGDPADPARRSDLAGTVSWTCGPLSTGPGPDEPLPGEDEPSDLPVSG
ncbi:MAG TPA: hypothetical protein VFK35_12125 [Candidatus Limnocylindrales bacterium]|nr:hypothetical protein [Candidatus Limnocylindrales bacterium]